MTRCFLEDSQWNQVQTFLSEEESHHLLRVLRVRRGEKITVFDGQGRQARAQVVNTLKGRAQVRILQETCSCEERSHVSLTLIQALPKRQLMDFIVQKATELGVASIVPLLTERVVVRGTPGSARQQWSRWQKIAMAAAKQCGRNWLPEVRTLVDFPGLLPELADFDLCCVASLHPGSVPFRKALTGIERKSVRKIALVVGPEGDFTEGETAALRSAGCILVNFGQLVLRVDTAALYGLALLTYEFPGS